jgi:peptide/nickel transport system ATP-binding protein
MIAMALMCEPRLLIADEPTTALDVTIQAQILDLLVTLQREFGMALLLITHDFGVVARVAQRVAVMYAGQVVETGPVAEVLASPRHPYTRGLLDCIPVPGGATRGRMLPTIAGLVPTIHEGAVGCGFSNRCPLAFPACAVTQVPLFASAQGNGAASRCLLEPAAAGLLACGSPVAAPAPGEAFS